MGGTANHLRTIPSVDNILASDAVAALLRTHSRDMIVAELRSLLEEIRRSGCTRDDLSVSALADRLEHRLTEKTRRAPQRVVNATGVVLHTNLGRAVLAPEAVAAIESVASAPCALEYDVDSGSRGSRDDAVARHLLPLTGAEAVAVVNNNAAAVLLALNTLARGKEVVVSRGELVEIGGSFRIPDICASSGAHLREVGTTNRTHLSDYAGAIGADTGLLLKVHPSNYAIEGFTADVSLAELVELGRRSAVPVVEDLGSGALLDLSQRGLPAEPVVAERVASGADAVTFSGDKLLGGPQAGLIAGKREAVELMQSNPLKRALRCDKMTLAALDATLRLYRTSGDPGADLPTLRYLTRPASEIEKTASAAARLISAALGDGYDVGVRRCQSQIGSGAQPTATLASAAVVITADQRGAGEIAADFRRSEPPIIGRVKDDCLWLDCRCVDDAAALVPTRRGKEPAPGPT